MLKDILAISGKSGLYKLVSQTTKGIIVESLDNGAKTMVGNSYKISTLKDIAIYTENGEKPLEEVFNQMLELEGGKKASVNEKGSAEELKVYFEKVVPDYDKDRVYVSDIKKVIKWYNILQVHGIIKLEKKEDKQEEETDKK